MIQELTERQREVLVLLANGNTAQQAADRLGVAVSTVRTTVTRILRALNASSIAHAVAIALAIGEIGVHQITINDPEEHAA